MGLTRYRELDDSVGEAHILIHRGTALSLLGRTHDAMICYADSLRLSRRLGLHHLRASALHRVAEVRLSSGAVRSAAAAAERARTLSREIGLARTEARALATLGRALISLGECDRAAACLRESVAMFAVVDPVEGDEARDLLTWLDARRAAGE